MIIYPKKQFSLKPIITCLIIILLSAALRHSGAAETAPRTPFKVPLANIAVSFDKTTGKYNMVRITFGDDETFVIAAGDDSHVKKSGGATVYREMPNSAYQLSDFEAKTVSRVCRTMIAALEEYEALLKNENWGKTLYLDSYMPRFLRGFHVMMCAAKDSPEALPRNALVAEEDYDNSENSPKSDARLMTWQTENDQIMKLRIASKELVRHTKEWQKNELNDSKRNPEISYSANFERAFNAFVRNYMGYVPR